MKVILVKKTNSGPSAVICVDDKTLHRLAYTTWDHIEAIEYGLINGMKNRCPVEVIDTDGNLECTYECVKTSTGAHVMKEVERSCVGTAIQV